MTARRTYHRLRDLLDVAVSSPGDGEVLTYNSAASKWENQAGGGGGGSQAFNGCRYTYSDHGGSVALFIENSAWLTNFLTTNAPYFDTGSPAYAAGGFDGGGLSLDGYLYAPADGYYLISASARINFSGSDTTSVECAIASQDRDGDWDDVDHFALAPTSSAGGLDITHWLAAGDRIVVTLQPQDGSTMPTAVAALGMQFLGTGTNPAL